MQSREGLVSSGPMVSSDRESDDSRMWYVRLRIRDDRLAKIWAWNLAEHDAIVWSDAEDRWKQLLAVPELRAAVRKETTSAFVRKRSTSDPPAAMLPSKAPTLLDIESQDVPTRAQLHAEQVTAQEDNEPTRVRLPGPSSSAPAPIDPFLQALTTSIPPAVITNPAPDIPRAPRLPNFETPNVAQGPTVQPIPDIAIPRGRSSTFGRFTGNATAKNIAWALLPVLGAAAFAFALNRSGGPSTSTRYGAGSVTSDGTYLDWLVDERQLAQTLATKLVGAAPVCSGAAITAAPASVTPEQLVSVAEGERGAVRATRGRTDSSMSSSRKRTQEKVASPNGKPGVSNAVAESSDFDRDAARTALRFAIARAKNCSNAGVSGSVMVTFASNGIVQGVQISQLVGDDVEPSCVTRAFSVSRVPPFTGSSVTVRKSF